MHQFEIAESFTSPGKELLAITTQFLPIESFPEIILIEKKYAFWKTITKKHRVGVYLILKKYQKRRYALAI